MQNKIGEEKKICKREKKTFLNLQYKFKKKKTSTKNELAEEKKIQSCNASNKA